MSSGETGPLPQRLAENQWIVAALFFFIISMAMGLFGDRSALFTLFWVLFAGFAIVCLSQAFPDTWNYMLWLIGIYILSFFGWLFAAVWSATPIWGTLWVGLGIFLEACAYGIGAYLILHIKEVRDALAGIEAEIRYETVPEYYVPLGIWSLTVFAFFIVANLNVWAWYLWSTGQASIAFYIGTDVALFALAIYVLWFPQTKLEYEEPAGILHLEPAVQPAPRPSGATFAEPETVSRSTLLLRQILGFFRRLLKPIRALRTRRGAATVGADGTGGMGSTGAAPGTADTVPLCPICNGALTLERRSCTNCGTVRTFSWCPRSEAYIVRCPHCRTLTRYGGERCRDCGQSIGERVPCSCGQAATVRNWKPVATEVPPSTAKAARAARSAP